MAQACESHKGWIVMLQKSHSIVGKLFFNYDFTFFLELNWSSDLGFKRRYEFVG